MAQVGLHEDPPVLVMVRPWTSLKAPPPRAPVLICRLATPVENGSLVRSF
jgi:hypothetical protein